MKIGFQHVAAAVVLCLAMPALAQDEQTGRTFSVKDSIEMTTFSDPYTRDANAAAKESPDGEGFVVVTTRGILRLNCLESSLWYFSAKELKGFLSGGTLHPPHPRLLFRVRGVPTAKQINSYGSMITDVQWSADSKSVLLLVERPRGRHSFFEVSISSGTTRNLTRRETEDIDDADSKSGTTAYLVRTPFPKQPDSEDGYEVLTGQTIFHILLPAEYPDAGSLPAPWKVRVLNGKTGFDMPTGRMYFPSGAHGIFRSVISPNGRFIVIASPVPNIPPDWSALRAVRQFDATGPRVDHSGRDFAWPWEYALIDVAKKSMHSLFGVPTGYAAGYGNVLQALWSKSGDELVVTNSFLPVPRHAILRPDSIKPCAIALYRLKTGHSECLAETRLPEQQEHLLSIAWDTSGNAIKTQWLVDRDHVTRVYTRSEGRWREEHAWEDQGSADRLKIYIQQELDVPPTLWVQYRGRKRLLWDPNPRFHDKLLGKASVYRWTDASGYIWHGALILPPGLKPASGYPLVIQTHGFYNEHEFLADGAFTTGFAAQPLASSGIAVLQMEDRQDKYTRPLNQEADDAVRGFESAIDHLCGDGLIDPSKVGIIGFSRTQWYVEKALEHAPKRYRAATLIDGVDHSYVSDMLFSPDSPISREDNEEAIGAPPFGDGLKTWLQHAAGFNLNKVAMPVRLEAIGKVSVIGEWETYSALRQQGKPVDLILISKGQHILQQPKERYASQQGNVDWFRFWLLGRERPDRDAQRNYRRWEYFSRWHVQ